MATNNTDRIKILQTIKNQIRTGLPSTLIHFLKVHIECPTQNMSGIKHEDECGVCFSSLGDSGKDSTEGVVILPCRHSFCRGCLLQYLVQNIRTGGRRISCMVRHFVESLFHASTWTCDSNVLHHIVRI